MRDTPVLSMVWFALCSSLVMKHNDLVGVFFAFVGSFGLAHILAAHAPSIKHSPSVTQKRVGLLLGVGSLLLLALHMEYSALSVMAGYLAFALWYSVWFRQITSVLETADDAISLSLLVALLAMRAQDLPQYRFSQAVWILYRIIRFALATWSTPSDNPTEPPPTRHFWILHGNKYDLTDFVQRHPGGTESILLGRGRDCTALFESYHPFTQQHRKVLEKYRSSNHNHDEPLPKDAFYNLLQERVAETLKIKGIDPIQGRSATPLRVSYYVFVFVSVLVCGYAHVRGSLVGSVLFAVFGWLIGSIGHDGGHFAVSRVSWINEVCVWSMSLLCNPIMWQHQHTYAHHSHTNDFDRDPDLHHFELLLRVHHRFRYSSRYENQTNWLYVALAYSLVVFGTCFWIPRGMIADGSLYGMVDWTDRNRPLRWVGMVIHLVSYVALIMVVPFWTHTTWPRAALAAVLHISTSGLLFAIFSQINHLNERSIAGPSKHQRKGIAVHSWAAEQIEASNNFATASPLWHVLSNGLNLQIEHHLFPGLNHCHLHHIAPTVRRVCQEYGVEYKSYETWSDLMGATLDWLAVLSTEPET